MNHDLIVKRSLIKMIWEMVDGLLVNSRTAACFKGSTMMTSILDGCLGLRGRLQLALPVEGATRAPKRREVIKRNGS